jgi:hypothetical protein
MMLATHLFGVLNVSQAGLVPAVVVVTVVAGSHGSPPVFSV